MDDRKIGGREGIKGLTGMLLMTFGLIEVVKLAHPRDWLAALLQARTRTMDAIHKAHEWQLAHQTAEFLHSHYNISRIAVAGDIVASEPLNFWSELVLVVWELQELSDRYTSTSAIASAVEPRATHSISGCVKRVNPRSSPTSTSGDG